ncbi:MAG TPA: thioredoxin domain-containing protein, partial [Anaeromyxobacter sp.]
AVADRALRHYARSLEGQPLALAEMLLALDFATDAPREVVLVWPGGEAPEPFLSVLRRTFLPNRALAGAPEGEGIARLGKIAAVAEGKVAAGGRVTAYVCGKGLCRLPAIAPEKLASQIAPVRPYA